MSDIMVIGAVTAEIEGNPYGQMMFADQNAGTISISYSGNGRNIAENLGRLGVNTSFVAAVGDDLVGRNAKRELEELSVDTEGYQLISGENTAMHIEILNLVGDLELAVGNWDVYKKVDAQLIEQTLDKLNSAKMVAVDCTFEEEVLELITERVDVPLFLDPATEMDSEKCKKLIGKFHTIAPDRAEASAISGLEIFSEDQLMAAGQWFNDQGVKRIFITMSGGGVYYKEGMDEGIIRPDQLVARAHETGAGAAFSAAVLDGFLRGMSVSDTAKYGMAAAEMAISVKSAVNPDISKIK